MFFPACQPGKTPPRFHRWSAKRLSGQRPQGLIQSVILNSVVNFQNIFADFGGKTGLSVRYTGDGFDFNQDTRAKRPYLEAGAGRPVIRKVLGIYGVKSWPIVNILQKTGGL